MSDEVVSLFTLMESHLSKTNLSENSTENNDNHQTCNGSEVLLPVLPGPRLVIPKFFPGNSPMKDFVAQQIANTLKAKERLRQQEEEQQKLAEEMERLKIEEKEKLRTEEEKRKLKIKEEEEYLIDLTAAIIPQNKQSQVPPKVPPKVEVVKTDTGSNMAAMQKISKLPLRFDKDLCLYRPWDPMLPCTTDMSYILKEKRRTGKCSGLGKVLCSRMQPIHTISVPYLIQKNNSNIVKFDFKTKSPGDIFRELEIERKTWKPKTSTRFTVDITTFI